MLRYVRNTILGLFAFAFGVGLGASDYLYQHYKAGGVYSLDDYTQLQIDRFDGNGGKLGLIFRKSSRVTPHLPEAPEGWEAYQWSKIEDEAMFSREQSKARRRHLVRAVPDLTFLDGMREAEELLYDVYLDDVARMYRKEDGSGLIDFKATVPGLQIGSEDWRLYDRKILAYYDHMDESKPFGSFDGVDWTERTGPVERASNLSLNHRLRKFEADLGPIRLDLRTRASDADIMGFLAALDLTGLRGLAATAPQRTPLPDPAAPRIGNTMPRSASGAVIASLEDCSSDRPRIPKVVFCY